MMKLIIAGGRDFKNDRLFQSTMAALTIAPNEIVCGMAAGADELGRQWAIINNIPIAEFPADWSTHGKAAGPRRNKAMAEYGTHLLAFWDGTSRGTANMLKLAQEHGLKIKLVRY
jgi:hypothetical protein